MMDFKPILIIFVLFSLSLGGLLDFDLDNLKGSGYVQFSKEFRIVTGAAIKLAKTEVDLDSLEASGYLTVHSGLLSPSTATVKLAAGVNHGLLNWDDLDNLLNVELNSSVVIYDIPTLQEVGPDGSPVQTFVLKTYKPKATFKSSDDLIVYTLDYDLKDKGKISISFLVPIVSGDVIFKIGEVKVGINSHVEIGDTQITYQIDGYNYKSPLNSLVFTNVAVFTGLDISASPLELKAPSGLLLMNPLAWVKVGIDIYKSVDVKVGEWFVINDPLSSGLKLLFDNLLKANFQLSIFNNKVTFPAGAQNLFYSPRIVSDVEAYSGGDNIDSAISTHLSFLVILITLIGWLML